MSTIAFEGGCQRLEELRILAESIPADIGPSAQGGGRRANTFENEQLISADAPNQAESMVVSMIAPQTAKTKGSKWARKEIECGDASSSLQKHKKGIRKCKMCGMYMGHYSTTCPLNVDVTARGRSGHRRRRGTMGTKRGRPPISRQLELEFMEAGSENTDEELYEMEI
jgi:hypothetical protein